MVLHAADPAALYAALEALARPQRRQGAELWVHNCVNNADVVSRCLGPQLDTMYQAVHSMVPSIEVRCRVYRCTTCLTASGYTQQRIAKCSEHPGPRASCCSTEPIDQYS